MRVLITGGSGFVGGHVIERLVRDGHEVHAIARSEASAAKVARYGATPIDASLGSLSPRAAEGIDAIVHCAAYVEEWGTRAQFWEGNVEGTRRMLEIATIAGVPRFVHVGTEAALFDGRDLNGIDESHPYPMRQRFLYSETKAEAERLVLAAHRPQRTTISVRPRLVWGPRDTSVLPAVLKMARAGRFSWVDGGRHRTSTCHVHNVAHAIALALTSDAPARSTTGTAYFVTDGEDRTMREVLGALASTAGVTLPDRSAPGWLLRPLAATIEAPYRLARTESAPPLTRFSIAMMSASVTVSDAKARRELGYAPVISWAEGIAQLRAAG